MRVTLSVIKADVGGWVGHSSCHPSVIDRARECLDGGRESRLLIDYHVTSCGDDLALIMTHDQGVESDRIHKLAWDTFQEGTAIARKLKLHGAGQDLVADTFPGNIQEMGPGVAEMEIVERQSETVLVFMANKAYSGAWNLPLYKMFADPFNTSGLVIAHNMHCGFAFEIYDIKGGRKITFNAPEEIYDMLVYLGATNRYSVKAIYHRDTDEIAAISSAQKLSMVAGRYIGLNDPVLITRAQGTFPAVGELLEPFAMPQLVEGWMRGSHNGPMMPCAQAQANPTRFDGPTRVTAYGFQLANGLLIGPRDMFDDPAFDQARHQANMIAEYMRSHGPFEPHRLTLDEMAYTTLPEVLKRLEERFTDL